MQLDTTMAETNAKREARRRRILENSENRLRRITARHNSDENEAESSRPLVKDDGVKPSLEKYVFKNGTCNIDSEVTSQDYVRLGENEHERLFSNINNKDTCSSEEQVSNREFTLLILSANRANLIVLAAIVNVLLILKLDHWFGQTVIVPYLLLMLGRLCSYKKLQESKDNNLLVIALMMCNIKPSLIYRIKTFFTLFNMIISDFSLYMFSFVLMRYLIVYYYYYNVTSNA